MRVGVRMLLAAMAGVMALGVLSGCSSSQDSGMYEMTAISHGALQVDEIADALLEGAALNGAMVCLDFDSIPSYYSFDPGLVEDAVVYMSANSSCADEIAVFEVTAGQDESDVITAVNNRVLSKARSFRDISPTEYEKLRKAVQVSISGYIVLAVTSHPETAQSVIAELFYEPAYTTEVATGQ